MKFEEGDTVRITAPGDSEEGRIYKVMGATGADRIWVNVGFGMIWRYQAHELELVTKHA